MHDESMLEVLENDESGSGEEGEEDINFSDGQGDEDDQDGQDAGEPLTSRGRKRRKRYWEEDVEKKQEKSLLEASI